MRLYGGKTVSFADLLTANKSSLNKILDQSDFAFPLHQSQLYQKKALPRLLNSSRSLLSRHCVFRGLFRDLARGHHVCATLLESFLLLLCSHSPSDIPPEHQRNVSIAAVRGAVRPSKGKFFFYVLSDFL